MVLDAPAASRLRRAGAAALGARRSRRWAIRHSGTLPEGPADQCEAPRRRPATARPAPGGRTRRCRLGGRVRARRQLVVRAAKPAGGQPLRPAMLRGGPRCTEPSPAQSRRSGAAGCRPDDLVGRRRRPPVSHVAERNRAPRPAGTRRSAPTEVRALLQEQSGGVLLSQGVYPQVPSALAGLTAVFGMGTGVTPPPWPPEICCQSGAPDRSRRSDGGAHEDSRASTSLVHPSPRPISTGRLSTLLCVHLRPINVVV